MKLPIYLFLGLVTPLAGWADASSDMMEENEKIIDAFIATVRSELSSGKVAALTAGLELKAEEAAVFWPIYQEYEAQLFALGDRRLDLIEDFAVAVHANALTDEFAQKIADDWFQLKTDHLQLLKTYHLMIATALSPMKAAQFVQLEHRFNMVTDLLIASEVPLIDPLLPYLINK